MDIVACVSKQNEAQVSRPKLEWWTSPMRRKLEFRAVAFRRHKWNSKGINSKIECPGEKK